jgi:hypothetical protein
MTIGIRMTTSTYQRGISIIMALTEKANYRYLEGRRRRAIRAMTTGRNPL